MKAEDKIVRSFAVRIRELGKRKHWSQERLAEEANIHRTYLGGIETARRIQRYATPSDLLSL